MMKLKLLVCLLALTTAPTLHALTVINNTGHPIKFKNIQQRDPKNLKSISAIVNDTLQVPEVELNNDALWTAPTMFENISNFEIYIPIPGREDDFSIKQVYINKFNTIIILSRDENGVPSLICHNEDEDILATISIPHGAQLSWC